MEGLEKFRPQGGGYDKRSYKDGEVLSFSVSITASQLEQSGSVKSSQGLEAVSL